MLLVPPPALNKKRSTILQETSQSQHNLPQILKENMEDNTNYVHNGLLTISRLDRPVYNMSSSLG